MTIGPNMDQSWQPIILISLTEYPSGNAIHINLQSIEALTEYPEQPEIKSVPKDYDNPRSVSQVPRKALPAHTVIVGKSGAYHQVKESYEEIMRRAVVMMNEAIGR